ncbi:MAG: type III polyketide synthase [Deltaproteobacteria bacterium]|nr:type III polyketide synthase [Deltaproteobacteria bacterium]
MATLLSSSITHPPHRYDQAEVIAALPLWLSADRRLLTLAQRVFENAAVQTRYGCRPLLDLAHPLSVTETSQLYRQYACQLGEHVVRESLARANVAASDVHLIITTSCTGFMIPSLDAYLANTLGFSAHVKRLPVTELGCAAGGVALARAFDYLQAFPHHTVLVVAVELPSLTFQFQDFSPANVVSSALFGDGAAAIVLSAQPLSGQPRILATESTLFPQTTEVMGFDLRDSGFHIVLSAEIPELVSAEVPQLVARFLAAQGLTVGDMSHFLLHPGGRRVLEGLVECLGIASEQATVSKNILRDYGNLSSASVLYILDRFLTTERTQAGDLGLLLAFGPGFSAESVLLRWE